MILACVRTGTKYGPEYVERIFRGVKRHSTVGCKFVLLTDQPETWPGVENHRVELSGWWAKMKLFEPSWRGNDRLVYLDLDTVVIGNIDPLLELETEFAICHSFIPAHLKQEPYKYRSCALALAPHYGRRVYDEFMANKATLIATYVRYGDQRAMEHIDGGARSLQDLMPPGFFSYYRDGFRKDASLLIFGAKAKPHNSCDHWVKAAWAA